MLTLATTLGAVGWGVTRTTPAMAATGCTPVFDFAGSGGNPVNEVPLENRTWQMQNFAWDNVHPAMYFTQRKVGSTTGDIWIVRTDLAGTKTGSMALHGFGHGQGFTVEPSGSSVFLWTESHATNATGTRVARIPFTNGAVVESASEAQDRTPNDAATGKPLGHPYPFYDSLYNRMWYWYLRDGSPRVVGYQMDAARAGDFGTRIADVHLPPLDLDRAFQGFAVVGGWVYIYEGNPPAPGDNDPSFNKPAYLSSWNIDRAAQTSSNETPYGIKRFVTHAGDFLKHREPEGLGLQIVNGKPRLGFGYSSVNDETARPVTRQATVYYKDHFRSVSNGPESC